MQQKGLFSLEQNVQKPKDFFNTMTSMSVSDPHSNENNIKWHKMRDQLWLNDDYDMGVNVLEEKPFTLATSFLAVVIGYIKVTLLFKLDITSHTMQ